MMDDIDGIIGGGISRKAIEAALRKFNFDFDRTVDYLLDRKVQKATAEQNPAPPKPAPKQPAKPQPKAPEKAPAQKLPTGVSQKTTASRGGFVDDPLIVERKQPRKMSKEVALELPLDKSTWNKLYPLIDYST